MSWDYDPKRAARNFQIRGRVEARKKAYPVGSRVEVIYMFNGTPAGTQGVVTGVNYKGTVYVKWDNGKKDHACDGYDMLKVISRPAV